MSMLAGPMWQLQAGVATFGALLAYSPSLVRYSFNGMRIATHPYRQVFGAPGRGMTVGAPHTFVA